MGSPKDGEGGIPLSSKEGEGWEEEGWEPLSPREGEGWVPLGPQEYPGGGELPLSP